MIDFCIKIKAMPQQDAYHNLVRKALEKDRWTITHDPFTIRLEDVKFYVDLAAEKLIEAEGETRKAAIVTSLPPVPASKPIIL